MAAIHAGQGGSKIMVFEKQKKPGRKLLATGNGRCNISNINIDFSHYHGHNPKFVNNVFHRFGLPETVEFFEKIGLPLVEGDEGKLYPASLQASSVVEILGYEAVKNDVTIVLNRRVEKIEKRNNEFILETAGKERHVFDAVIVATGGCAYPSLGASAIGYDLARYMGHRVFEPFPAILPINIPLKIIHRLQGIKKDAAISVKTKGKIQKESRGELLFTSFGVSGPAALEVSRFVNELVLNRTETELVIDLFPDYTIREIEELTESLWQDPLKETAFSLLGIMPRRLAEVLLSLSGIPGDKLTGTLTGTEKKALRSSLKELVLKPGSPRGFNEAVVAAGGVDVNEVNPSTMESKLTSGLFLTGEILDIDGDSGGFNLQFAWSTGAIAGQSQG